MRYLPLLLAFVASCECSSEETGPAEIPPPGGECLAVESGLLGASAGMTTDIAAVDVDLDGDIDIVWANRAAPGIEVRLNDGNGKFAPRELTVAEGWSFILPVDIDGDSDIDLVATRPAPTADAAGATIFTNDGTGQFSENVAALPSITGDSDGVIYGRAAAGDVNGDGAIDLLVPIFSLFTETVYDAPNVLLLNGGNGTFARAEAGILPEIPPYTDHTLSAVMGDVTGDGAIDIFLGEAQSRQRLLVNANDGTGRLLDQTYDDGFGKARLPSDTLRGYRSEMVDADQDGDLDVIIAGDAADNEALGSHLFRNDGKGYFTRVPLSSPSAPRDSRGLGTGDLNGDGLLDIVIGQGTDVANEGRGVEILMGRSDGQFAPATSIPQIDKGIYGVAVLDINGDGLDDLALGVNLAGADGDGSNFVMVSGGGCELGEPITEPPPQPGEFVQVGAGTQHSCARRDDGSVTCWGQMLADPPGESFTDIAVGNQMTCGVTESQEARCWGIDVSGLSSPPPGPFSKISMRHLQACGLRPNGTVECWGGGEGRTPPLPPAGETFKQVSMGWSHACGVTTADTIVCWSDPIWQSWDFMLPPPGSFLEAIAGNEDSCALDTSQTAVCFGRNVHGEGQPPPESFKQLSLGWYFTCGIAADDTVKCWGLNDYGQTDAPSSGSFLQVSTGHRHACALTTEHALVCWGDNQLGQASPPMDQR